MAYPVRHLVAQRPYFVTARTMHSRFLLKPDPIVNQMIGAILARGVRLHGVQLFDFVFTSNHFHMIIAAPNAVCFSSFMQYLLSNIAIKVGRFFNWRNSFWGRRYSCEPILDDQAFLERVRYIKAHGVKEKLVACVEDWPGLTSLPELAHGVVRSFPWRSWTKLWKLLRQSGRQSPGREERYSLQSVEREETLVLSPYPMWSELKPEERQVAQQKLIREVNAEFAWTTQRSDALVNRVLKRPAFDAPRDSKHTPRPKCHSCSEESWLAYVAEYRALVIAYRSAARQWIRGIRGAAIPPGFLLPPAWRWAAALLAA